MLRKYGVEYYEIPESRSVWIDGKGQKQKLPSSQEIDKAYRDAFEKALKTQKWNDKSRLLKKDNK